MGILAIEMEVEMQMAMEKEAEVESHPTYISVIPDPGDIKAQEE